MNSEIGHRQSGDGGVGVCQRRASRLTDDLPPAFACHRISSPFARVAELADAADSKSADESRVGSIPTLGTFARGRLGVLGWW